MDTRKSVTYTRIIFLLLPTHPISQAPSPPCYYPYVRQGVIKRVEQPGRLLIYGASN